MNRPLKTAVPVALVAVIAFVATVFTTDSRPASASDTRHPAPAVQTQTARSPQLLVVQFHADWCGTCKAMDPSLAELQQKVAGKNVLFVTLDITDEATKDQAELLAAALGLGNLWIANEGKSGTVRLVEPATKQSVGSLTRDMSVEDMHTTVASKLPSDT